MFYGLCNLDNYSGCTYVQFIVIVPAARSSIPVNNISERADGVIAKFVSSFVKDSPQRVGLSATYTCRC
jgi:hypothetical protein